MSIGTLVRGSPDSDVVGVTGGSGDVVTGAVEVEVEPVVLMVDGVVVELVVDDVVTWPVVEVVAVPGAGVAVVLDTDVT
ncbi:hypothetical protein SAMD00019534_063720 [Acytostelium subglobosum LB1]|uniref:hypothetical protein n=1 Tax=Acytostelium subglobosum LB1 TaxID=1410327 RepID=UPI000644F3E0|nr:hypothetical protein SAMD00019534_063720 [Acytostelium subglobosum LB1]GAM23197.1 hypothetical protein SAMD00019534_063720 [Acytostelium subglobosum LB1]|eukprot:XP_012753646.1 hypothetical protein SAMD00019534_063720 [Acytostelium subglobosum LB1]